MLKNSDKNKLGKFNKTVQSQSIVIPEFSLKNYLFSSNVKKYSFSHDVLKRSVKVDTDWETLDYLETLQEQYKFWEINFEKIDITLLPFIVVEVLTKNNITNAIASVNKIFQVKNDNSIKLHVGVYFSEYSEMIQYNPIDVKLLIYFNYIPLVRKQNLNPGDNFTNLGTGLGGG